MQVARKSAEQSLLSSIINDGDYSLAVGRGITADHFHIHRPVWEWITKYAMRNRKTPSEAALKMVYPEFRLLPVHDTGHFSDEVQKSHQRYIVTEMLQEATDLVTDGDVDKAIDILYRKSVLAHHSLGNVGNDTDVIKNYDDVLSTLEGRYDRVKATGLAGIPTGFSLLDHKTGGPQPGQIWVVAARPGERKTWTMIRMGAAATMAGYSTLFFALEMTRADVAARLHTFLAKGSGKRVFDSMNVTRGTDYSMVEYKRFLRELRGTVGGRFHVADAQRGRVSPLTIAASIEKNKPDVVYVDYLTLLEGTTQEWGTVADNMGMLASMSKEYNIPIVVASQLNRGAGRDGGDLSNLSRTDSVGQDADAVINLSKPSKSTCRFKMVKFRHGEADFKWYAEFRPGKGVFDEVTYDRAMEIRDEDRDGEDD